MGKCRRLTTGIFLAGLLANSGVFAAKIPDRATSVSGEFIIFSPNQSHRNAVAERAEEIKDSVLHTLYLRDNWKHPILVRLQETQIYGKTPVPFQLTMHDSLDETLRIQLDVSASGPVDKEDMEREVIRALLLEIIYRDEDSIAGKPYFYPPDWLVEAVLASATKEDTPLDPLLFAQLIKKGGAPNLDDFLNQKPTRMDSTSRIIYRAQASALLQTWLGTPEGRRDMAKYLGHIATAEPTKEMLLADFSAIRRSEQKLQRLWTLAIARSSAMDRTDPFSVEETEKKLAKILNVGLPLDPKKPDQKPLKGPDALIPLAKRKDSKILFHTMIADLLRLNIRAHPTYQPIIQQYLGILERLSKGKVNKIDKYIAQVEAERKIVSQRMDKISDYLNWYEASKMHSRSGQFDEILHNSTGYDIEKPGGNDAISRYLDALEEQGW